MPKIVIKCLNLTNFFALHAQKSNSICFSVPISIFILYNLYIFFVQFLASLQKILPILYIKSLPIQSYLLELSAKLSSIASIRHTIRNTCLFNQSCLATDPFKELFDVLATHSHKESLMPVCLEHLEEGSTLQLIARALKQLHNAFLYQFLTEKLSTVPLFNFILNILTLVVILELQQKTGIVARILIQLFQQLIEFFIPAEYQPFAETDDESGVRQQFGKNMIEHLFKRVIKTTMGKNRSG